MSKCKSNAGLLSMSSFVRRKTYLEYNVYRRMLAAVFMQSHYSPVADDLALTLQVGKTILITGGSIGIGFEIAKALCKRGATVIIANRAENKLRSACDSLSSYCQSGGSVKWLTIDLGDLSSVASFTQRLAELLGTKKLDTVIENAGVWPKEHSTSPQGIESSCATNALGHYLLRNRLHRNGLLASSARIVVVTGDIYIKANDCTLDFKYCGEGEQAYCRSKLGVHWLFNHFHKQFPNYFMVIVHPGVIRTELAVNDNELFGLASVMKSMFLLSEEQGAQAPLICAVEIEEALVNGGYYHNTCGLVELSKADPVLDAAKSARFIQEVQNVIEAYL